VPSRTVPVPARVPFPVHRERTRLRPLALDGGATLDAPVLQWTLLGTPNADRSNVIVVSHALTGTPDVHDWWAPLVGPGRALDTDQYAILCANVLGGCAGSSGPRAGDTTAFPALTTRDQARALLSLLEALGVQGPRLIVGGSLGGMVTLELAALAPERVAGAVVFAAPAAQTALGAGWHAIMRTALEVGGERDGLALARMAGMLSYRSASGFEERFGGQIDAQGAPAIGGWLTRHGERLVQRFEAASYRALIDAMDRHDVARGRGSLTDALGRIADRITGVGIPGDLLYPDDVVRAWTGALGARHVALDSVHGHDAFLLEVEQVDAILREALERATPRRVAAPRVALAGCGSVGDAFAGALARSVRPLATVTQVLVREPDRRRLGLEALTRSGRVPVHALTRDADAVLAGEPDVLVEVLGGLEPAHTLVRRALRRGVRVITANKELVAAHGPELEALATEHDTRFDFEGAVGAGIPIVRVLRSRSPGPEVRRIEAILNGATNFVLDAVAEGASFDDAIATAQVAGYAEADPSRDLDGRDAEAKLRILAWLAFGEDPRTVAITRRGIDRAAVRWTRLVSAHGDAVRLLATLERDANGNVHGTIRPVRVPAESGWAATRGPGNRFEVHYRDGFVMTLVGDGAGGAATARALISDLRP
jgi:homoserine O-acetyltransferase